MIVHIIGCFNQSSTLLYKNATVYYYDKEVLQVELQFFTVIGINPTPTLSQIIITPYNSNPCEHPSISV